MPNRTGRPLRCPQLRRALAQQPVTQCHQALGGEPAHVIGVWRFLRFQGAPCVRAADLMYRQLERSAIADRMAYGQPDSVPADQQFSSMPAYWFYLYGIRAQDRSIVYCSYG